MNIAASTPRGQTEWRAQIEGTIEPLIQPKVAFTGAGILAGLVAIGSAWASRSGPSPGIVAAGMGAITAIGAGTAAFLLSREREGLVDNPAFDARELLERDQKLLVGAQVKYADQVTDEHGVKIYKTFVDDVHGVYRSKSDAQEAVDQLNSSSNDPHVVAWIRSDRDMQSDARDGWYSAGFDREPGTDDVYKYVAVSLTDEHDRTRSYTSDLAYVGD